MLTASPLTSSSRMEPESGRPSLARAINVRRAIASSLVFSFLLPVGAHHLECSHVYPLRHYCHCNMALSSSIRSKFVTSLQFCLGVNYCPHTHTGILVYTDGGVGAGENCVAMTLASLKKAVSALNMTEHAQERQLYLVETTTSDELIQGQWTDACSLLVMPGGRDLPYVAKLQGRATRESGICARWRELSWYLCRRLLCSFFC